MQIEQELGRIRLEGPQHDHERRSIEARLFDETPPDYRLDRFLVCGELGRGGMGTVLEAYDQALDRTVAIKLVRERLSADQDVRLRREAQALAQLSHPNVVGVHEIGTSDSQTFIVMERVRGTPLDEWQQQPHSWAECVEVYEQAGRGLAAAHAVGLIHRDFKPSNCILDEEGRVRVLDFGLAQYLGDEWLDACPPSPADADDLRMTSEHGPGQRLTRTGARVGTTAYMAPEQWMGNRTDARSDQFSFCVSLWEAVYGERPFPGQTIAELRTSAVQGRVQPAPKGRHVPTRLRSMLLRGMAADPEERWPSMEALLEQLWRLVAPRRWRWLVLAGTLSLLAVGVAIGATRVMEWTSRCTGARTELVGVWDDTRKQVVQDAILGTGLSFAQGTWERVATQIDEYAQNWMTAHTDACEATRVRGSQSEEAMDLRMHCLGQGRTSLRVTVNALASADADVVTNAATLISGMLPLARCNDVRWLQQQALQVPPPKNREVARQVAALDDTLAEANANQHAGKYREGLRLADGVVERAEPLKHEPLMVRAWLRQGALRQETGHSDAAVDVLKQAYGVAVANTMSNEAANISSLLMYILGPSLAQYDEARGWAEHAEPLSRAAGTKDARARYLTRRGCLAFVEGEYEDARDFHQRALAISESMLDQRDTMLAATLHYLGDIEFVQGQPEKARDFYLRALAIREQALGLGHPALTETLTNLGTIAWSHGEFENAFYFHQRARAITEDMLGLGHPRAAGVFEGLGAMISSQGDYRTAQLLYHRAQFTRLITLRRGHPDVAFSFEKLGHLATSQGDYQAARGFHLQALDFRKEALGDQHPYVAWSYYFLGEVAFLQVEYEDSRAFHELALAIRQKALGPEHPAVANSVKKLRHVALSQVQRQRAHNHYKSEGIQLVVP
ncbi:MAG: serine/threonine-protein kinase [Deltaproteobacteria bacterium]|nr:serine/threonine-protein kinase [Deltaproteobacteria bacterium]